MGLPSSIVVLEDVIKLSVHAPDCSCNCAHPDRRPFQSSTRSSAIRCHLLDAERALIIPVPLTDLGLKDTGGPLTSWRRRGLEKEKPRGKDPERGAWPQREARPRPRRCAPRERAGPARARGRAPDVALAAQSDSAAARGAERAKQVRQKRGAGTRARGPEWGGGGVAGTVG